MINPFKMSKNNRYTLNDRTIIIEDTSKFSVIWYYLDEWRKYQPIKINLHKSSKWWFMLHAQKYKFI